MDYLTRPSMIPDMKAIMAHQYGLGGFFGKLGALVQDYCAFDMAKTLPVKVECPDESQGLKVLYFISTFGTSPFVGGKLGAELDINGITPASHHGENLVYVMGSHTGYDQKTKTMGRLYREKEGGFSACCGKLAAVMAPYLRAYDDARNNIKVFMENRRMFVEVPNRLLGTPSAHDAHPFRLRLTTSLIKGSPETDGTVNPKNPGSVIFEIHPDLQKVLKAKKRKVTREPTPIGDDLAAGHFRFSSHQSAPLADGITSRLQPLMHHIVSSRDYAPMVTIANVNTWIEFNRFVDAMHALPDVHSKGVFGVSGLTVDLYCEDRAYHYSNVYYPQYAYFKRPGQREGVVMGPPDIHGLLQSYTPKSRLSIDQILEQNDEAAEQIKF
jgi:hypothetical protein